MTRTRSAHGWPSSASRFRPGGRPTGPMPRPAAPIPTATISTSLRAATAPWTTTAQRSRNRRRCKSAAMPAPRCWAAAGAGALYLSLAAAALPQAHAADFYLGKTLTVIVGFAPGGGVDSTARVMAKHLVRFIPGQPGLVIQNLEGAAGIIAANHLGR